MNPLSPTHDTPPTLLATMRLSDVVIGVFDVSPLLTGSLSAAGKYNIQKSQNITN